jgi:signal peptide peptidase SppA
MKRSLLLAEFAATPWAILPHALTQIATVLMRWNSGAPASTEIMETVAADQQARAMRTHQAAQSSGGGIAVLPLYGIITQRPVADASGPGTLGISGFTQLFRQALADPAIAGIIIDVDSPGGSVFGVQELADEIFSARGVKPIVGIANSQAASAAYWIGTQCAEFYCTPGGMVGSVGVYMAHEDMSKALADAGVSVSLIYAGKRKTEGNPYGPLDDEARANLQSQVDSYYAAFTKAVSRGRGPSVTIAQVRDGMGQGRCMVATDALAANMIDGIKSFGEVVTGMQKTIKANRSARADDLDPAIVAEVLPVPEDVQAPATPVVESIVPTLNAALVRTREIESLG